MRLSQSPNDEPLIRPVSFLSSMTDEDEPMTRTLSALVLVLACATTVVRADDDHHKRDDITAAVKNGKILELSEILERVRPQLKGKILEIEIEGSSDHPIYEIYVLTPGGRRIEYEIDAVEHI